MAGAGVTFEMDADSFEDVLTLCEEFCDNSYQLINDLIHDEAGELIRAQITPLIPQSGRTWKGKTGAAATSNPYASDDTGTMLAVTVHTRTAYNYLYFPDDGSNSKRHCGNQQFFARGAEAATPEIIELCLGRLAEAFGGEN